MSFTDLVKRMKKGPSEVVGIDFGHTATKIVRIHKSANGLVLTGAEIADPLSARGEFAVPPKLKARYVSLAISSASATAKLLTFPGAIDAGFDHNLAKSLGVDKPADSRVAYRVIAEGIGRQESRVLAAAIPAADADPVMERFATGIPAPCSLELAPLATLTAFEAGPVSNTNSPTCGLVEFGTLASSLAIFHKRSLVLLRRIDFGSRKLLDRVTSTLHIDEDTALNILSDNAFDISELLTDIMSPLVSQLIVSRDFVERRENCSLRQLHCIGGLTTSPSAMHELEHALNIDVKTFDPFSIPTLQNAIQDETSDPLQNWRFAAAVGAALGTLQEEP